jgi:hypothetical protein
MLEPIGASMTVQSEARTVREAVGVFEQAAQLQDAIDELLSSGFDRADLSLLAGEEAVAEKLGPQHPLIAALADDPDTPRTHYASPEAFAGAQSGIIGVLTYVGALGATGAVVASGGTLAALIIATTVTGGAGALIGVALAKFIGDRHASHLQEQLNEGGLLLWVRTWDVEDERKATEILRRHSGRDVHIHALPAGP